MSSYGGLWPIHALLMIISFCLMLAAIIVSRAFKRKHWRHAVHRKLGMIAGTSAFFALLVAVLMVEQEHGIHLSGFHGQIGALALLLLFSAPVMALSLKRVKRKRLLLSIHRSSGYLSLAGMLIAMVLIAELALALLGI